MFGLHRHLKKLGLGGRSNRTGSSNARLDLQNIKIELQLFVVPLACGPSFRFDYALDGGRAGGRLNLGDKTHYIRSVPCRPP